MLLLGYIESLSSNTFTPVELAIKGFCGAAKKEKPVLADKLSELSLFIESISMLYKIFAI